MLYSIMVIILQSNLVLMKILTERKVDSINQYIKNSPAICKISHNTEISVYILNPFIYLVKSFKLDSVVEFFIEWRLPKRILIQLVKSPNNEVIPYSWHFIASNPTLCNTLYIFINGKIYFNSVHSDFTNRINETGLFYIFFLRREC